MIPFAMAVMTVIFMMLMMVVSGDDEDDVGPADDDDDDDGHDRGIYPFACEASNRGTLMESDSSASKMATG